MATRARTRGVVAAAGLCLVLLLAGCGNGNGESDIFNVGGTLTGLDAGKSVTLQNNGGDDLELTDNGSFDFGAELTDGSYYAVTVSVQPDGQACQVAGGSGTIDGADITDVAVTCVDEGDTYPVYGTVSGLGDGDTVILDLNGNLHPVSDNGSFTFPDQLIDGADYLVTVNTHPDGLGCRVFDGAGIVAGAAVTVGVRCQESGSYDANFGNTGIVLEHDTAGGDSHDRAYDITVDRYDRVLVTGYSYNAAGNADMVIWRYLPDGTLDPDFGSGGVVIHGNAAGGDEDDVGRSITVTPTGDYLIYVAGDSANASGNKDMVVWCFQEDGTLGDTFDTDGVGVYHGAAGGDSHDQGYDIVLNAEDHPAVTGSSVNADGDTDMVIWRLRKDGVELAAFVHDSAAGGDSDDSGAAILIDQAARYLVSGISVNADGFRDMAIWRYDQQGQGGIKSTDSDAAGGGQNDNGSGVALTAQSKILVSGSSINADGNLDMVLWQYLSPGDGLDTDFGTSGRVIDAGAAGGTGDDAATDVLVDGAGRVVVAGYSDNADGNADLVTWRFLADGTLDASFGPDGGVVVRNSPAGGMSRDILFAVAQDSQGRILAAGYSTNGNGDQDMVVMALVP